MLFTVLGYISAQKKSLKSSKAGADITLAGRPF